MNQTIRTFFAKIPMAKPMYNALKRRREERRNRREQAKLSKNQPIIRLGSPECFEGMPLRVSWQLTSYCNFRCSYCFDARKGYKKAFCTLEQAETAIKHLASANRPNYQVTLSGGEPTTHPHLAEIITLLCQNLSDRLEKLEIITNGSFSESQMEAILKAGELCNVRLIVSIHLEYMKVEQVVELVKRYSERTELQMGLMFHPEKVDKAMSVADVLCDLRRDYPFWMYVTMLREPPRFDRFDSRYTQEHFNLAEKIREKFWKMHEQGPSLPKNQQKAIGWDFMVERKEKGCVERHERIPLLELRKLTGCVFTGMTCCAGISSVRIEVDGRCKGMVCGLDRPTCNIFEENPFLREDWMHGVFCTQALCGCNVNYRIPKFKSPAAAQKFIAQKKEEQKKLMGGYQEA